MFDLLQLSLNLLKFSITLAEQLAEIDYKESFAVILNPEIGWTLTFRVTNESDSSEYIPIARNKEQSSLIKLYLYAPGYENKDFDYKIMNNLKTALQTCRESGVKAVFWVSYNNSGEYMEQNKTQIFRHIEQLAPILQEYNDVIAFYKTGFIGPWGEMHSSNLDNPEDTKEIMLKLLDAIPRDRMITVRRPEQKVWVFGWDPISKEEAFSGVPKARVGFFNDCFLSSDTDWGTYPALADLMERYKRLVENDSKYTPYGGETCALHNHNNCTSPYFHELERFHVRELSRYWNNRVWDKWYRQGCYFTVRQRLGYRFVLRKMKITPQVKPGGVLHLILTIDNVGYGPLYNPRPVELILRNTATKQEVRTRLNTDPRWWQPELSPIILEKCFRIPHNLSEGTYDVFLNLPDPSENLKDDSRFSVRFANYDVWEYETGYNKLFSGLKIISSAPGSCTSETEFKETSCKFLNPTLEIKIANTYTEGQPVAINLFSPLDSIHVQIKVFDMWGRKKLEEKYTLKPGENRIEIPYSALSTGLNIITVRTPEENKTFKVIKK